MHDPFELVEDAAQLLGFGLRPRLRPAKDVVYGDLLRRYRIDPALRQHVDAIARGLGLVVLGASAHGLALGAEVESPFAMRLGDYRRHGLSVSERISHGLVQLAIAAWCFPTAQSLEDADTVAGAVITVPKLVDYLVDLSRQLEAQADTDPELGGEELQEAWRLVLARAETRATHDGRRVSTTLAGMVAYALEQLESGGLLRKLGDEDGGRWQALGSYRLQVRELASHRAAMLVREAGTSIAGAEV